MEFATAVAGAYRVLILPATRRDAEATGVLLASARIEWGVCYSARELATQINQSVGAILFTDAAFYDDHFADVIKAIVNQPTWSDIPVLLLCRGEQSEHGIRALESLRNVTILDRPSSSRTLLSSIKAALRARRRQYQLREQLAALHRSEATLRSVSNDLKDSNRRKDEFLAMLAHELRNPLAPIRNVSEILERKLPADAAMRPMVHIVKRQVTQLSRLVDDLLDVSRITEGRIELQRDRLEIGAIIAQAVESVDPLLREKNHKLSIAPANQPLYLKGDHARLVQCVANILTNAAKYTDAGGTIRLWVEKRGELVAIVISDNGTGIAPHLLPRIFDLFVQGERTLDRSQGGLGLGLSIVKRLIEMHNGNVVASSDGHGCGSTFEIQLPLIDAPLSFTDQASQADVKPKRILIVDDNEDAANSLAALLSLDGHSTEAVYGATDAIARVSTLHPDVVVLDIGLPQMNGYEVAKIIRAELSAVQLIALTGYGQADDIQHAHEVGFDGHLIKPADVSTLARMIDEFKSSSISAIN
jgi:two-component system, sensor histidine kinase